MSPDLVTGVGAVSGVLASAAAFLLIISGSIHVVRPSRPAWSGLCDRHVCRLAERLMPVGLTVVGVSALVGHLAGGDLAAWSLVAQTAIYACLTSGAAWVRVQRPGTPCGCFVSDKPISWSTVGRNFSLFFASLWSATQIDARPLWLVVNGLVIAMAYVAMDAALHPTPTQSYYQASG